MRTADSDTDRIGLPFQYRLPFELPQIPVRGVELRAFLITLGGKSPTEAFNAGFSLRLHVEADMRDFPFEVRYFPAPPPEPSDRFLDLED